MEHYRRSLTCVICYVPFGFYELHRIVDKHHDASDVLLPFMSGTSKANLFHNTGSPVRTLTVSAFLRSFVSAFVPFRAYLVYPRNWRASGATSRGNGVTVCYIIHLLLIVRHVQRRMPFLLPMHISLTVNSYEKWQFGGGESLLPIISVETPLVAKLAAMKLPHWAKAPIDAPIREMKMPESPAT
jgi:hypothetical protein